MGICSSCLSLDRKRGISDEDESSRLLFDDPHTNQYGSFGDQHAGLIQADPQEVQRETEALQKVVMQTSNHLVDIFAMMPQNIQRTPTTIFSGQDARLLRYQGVLAKMSTSIPSEHHPAESLPNASDGWLSDEEDMEEMKSRSVVKSDEVGPLLGGFADAESAMK